MERIKSDPEKVIEYYEKSLIHQAEKVACDICGSEPTRHNLTNQDMYSNCIRTKQ